MTTFSANSRSLVCRSDTNGSFLELRVELAMNLPDAHFNTMQRSVGIHSPDANVFVTLHSHDRLRKPVTEHDRLRLEYLF